MSAFTIEVPQSELDDLRRRLLATRWPDSVADDWSRGTPPDVLRRVIDHWAGAFDWRAVESRLNAFEHVKIDGVHALLAGTRGATPLLLVHGWPDSFLRFEKAIPLLADRFELVIPSVPGYGFSDRPTDSFGPDAVADAFAKLMSSLGHERFGVHGADIGSTIAEQVAMAHPDRVIGLHLGDVPLRRLRTLDPADLTVAEAATVAKLKAWDTAEGGYSHLHRTKPQTLAASLSDSPAGLAAWIVEKFRAWSDCDGDVFSRFTLDELAANLTIYWVTNTGGSSARYYYDVRIAKLDEGRVEVPTGVAAFPKDIVIAPRESAERWYRIERWTEMPRGGHFGPWEEPEAWAAEITAFFDQV